jgi:hypothetical protein
MFPEFSFPTVMYGIETFLDSNARRSAVARPAIAGLYSVALGVSLGDRMRSFFVFVGDSCTYKVFGYEPDLKLVHAKNIANQQVISPIVATGRRGTSRLAGCTDDQFVSLHQTEQLHGNIFTAPRRAGNARCLGNVVSHGDGNSAQRLNALGQRVDNPGLFAEVFVVKEMELVKRGARDLPMVLFVHIA